MKIIPILVVLYLHEGPAQVIAACNALGIDGPVAGCAVPKGTTCEIHVTQPSPGPQFDWGLTVIGHEYFHCVYKDFHQ